MDRKKEMPEVTMKGNIDKKTFRKFSLFHAFVRQKAWRNPLFFVLIMSGFAAICFSGRGKFQQAELLGGVLLGIGLLLPVIWFLMFLASVNRQAKANKLSSGNVQYVVTLSSDGVKVRKGKEMADFSWKDVTGVYKVRGCIYLYMNTGRAFLLPDCSNTPKALDVITRVGSGTVTISKLF